MSAADQAGKKLSTDYTDGTDGAGGSKASAKSVKSVDAFEKPVGRRDALKVMAAAGGLASITRSAEAQTQAASPAPAKPQPVPLAGPRGTPTDPDLLHPTARWPRKLSASELATLAALCDSIIPADAKSPSASTVGVPAYINEYVSAPYDGQLRDLIRVRGGISWLNLESMKRFGRTYTRAGAAERARICDDICFLPKAKPEFQAAARFFDLIRDLTAVGFYTTDAGMKDLQYIGNMALPRFDGPPPEVMKHLGLT